MPPRPIMSLCAVVGAVFAAGAATAYSLPPDPVPVDGGPPIRWIVRPDVWKLSDAAHEVDVGLGSAQVECVIDDAGRLRQCEVIAENPPGHKLGAFMLLMAKTWRAALADANGASSEGRRVRLGFGMGRSQGL